MDEHRYFTYIVGSNSGTLYIGVTNDLERRMREHRSGEFEGLAAKYGCNLKRMAAASCDRTSAGLHSGMRPRSG